MSQSLTKIYVHIVFHVKSQSVTINPTYKHLLYFYIRTVISDRDSVPIEINPNPSIGIKSLMTAIRDFIL